MGPAVIGAAIGAGVFVASRIIRHLRAPRGVMQTTTSVDAVAPIFIHESRLVCRIHDTSAVTDDDSLRLRHDGEDLEVPVGKTEFSPVFVHELIDHWMSRIHDDPAAEAAGVR